MSKWVSWCIANNLGWFVLVVVVMSIPLFLIVGAYFGAVEGFSDWRSDFKSVRRAAQKGDA